MSLIYDETFLLRERTTHIYEATLTHEDGNGIAPADLAELTLTVYDVVTGAIINGRENQDVLNANDVVLESNGALEWTIHPADNIILDDTRLYEEHVALFRWKYPDNDDEAGHLVVRIIVQNAVRIP